MQNKLLHNWQLPPTWLRFFIVSILVLGIFFRFVNLGRKVYWTDETYTSLRVSGYTHPEYVHQVFDKDKTYVTDIKFFQKYQKINSEKSLIDTVKGLAVEEPQHPPLYYIMARLWMQVFGNSLVAIRSLSSVLSLLVFPCIYWLCLELFNSSIVGWIAIALIAVSPFHVLYAQEAREYTLWTVTVLLSSAALLHALRLESEVKNGSRIRNWSIYAATVALALYSYLSSVFVLVGHGIYVLISHKFRFNKTVKAYILASFIGFLVFLPWFLIIIKNASQVKETMAWVTEPKTLSYLVNEWIYNQVYVFVDFWYYFTYYPSSHFNFAFGKFLIPLILIIIGYSLYFICRQTPVRVWLFILTLIGVTALALVIPDLISGGYRSTMSRYLIPCYLGVELAVAYLLATQINPINAKVWQQKLWQSVTILLLAGGIVSCAVSSQAETWWNKRTISYDEVQIARVINQSPKPLLFLGRKESHTVFTLGHLLEPKVRFQIVTQTSHLKVTEGFSNVFLYHPSQELKDELEKEQHYKAKIVYKGRKQNLWQIARQPENL